MPKALSRNACRALFCCYESQAFHRLPEHANLFLCVYNIKQIIYNTQYLVSDYVYIYIHIYIYIYICMCICICRNTYINIYIYIHIDMQIYIHRYRYRYRYRCRHTCSDLHRYLGSATPHRTCGRPGQVLVKVCLACQKPLVLSAEVGGSLLLPLQLQLLMLTLD